MTNFYEFWAEFVTYFFGTLHKKIGVLNHGGFVGFFFGVKIKFMGNTFQEALKNIKNWNQKDLKKSRTPNITLVLLLSPSSLIYLCISWIIWKISLD